MKISFIIPMYNCENYIRDCLDSILKINYQDYEIIVVNDGSTDNGQAIVDKYKKKFHYVKSFEKKNEGLSLTRNYGLEKATGDYIFFIDSDDMIVPKEVDYIIDICNRNKYDIIAGSYKFYYDGKFENAPFTYENLSDNNLHDLYNLENLTAEAVKFIVKRSFLIEHNIKFKANLLHEDELYMVELLAQADKDKTIIIDRKFYLYRKHGNTITSTKNPKRNHDMLIIAKQLYTSNLINKDNKDFIIKRANLLYIGAASTFSIYEKSQRKKLKAELKSTLMFYKKNIKYKKDKMAYFIISIMGFYIFSVIQSYRHKPGRRSYQ